MKACLIDSITEEVSEINLKEGVDSIYQAIGQGCERFQGVKLADTHRDGKCMLYVDDDARTKPYGTVKGTFTVSGVRAEFWGPGLIS
jgi:hypothetical protein